jgi:hypothetical protein
MRVNLPRNSFSFFKIVVGTSFFLVVACFNQIAALAFISATLVGRAHSLGAWLAMWRAKKLTLKYVAWMLFLALVISFWGTQIVPLVTLAFVTHILFTFHFIFDEFDLQEESRSTHNLVSSINPALIIILCLCRDYFNLTSVLNFNFFIILAATLLVIELIYVQEINWFFVQTKVLTLFALLTIYVGVKGSVLLGVFLIFHYFFWFIYPVYKLHKYKREERDGLIFILLLIVSSNFYISGNSEILGETFFDLALRVFYIGTIVHIFSTAPFGYFFGLERPKVYA